jgi:selenide,water dikinase
VRHLNSDHPAELLVGPDGGDDAAVWRLDDERALVSTADFITPVVDDARTWGRVAAANSVSDVYAMGGRPLFALNLVCWNTEQLSTELLGEVLEGGHDVAHAAGFAVVGGHTIDDPEPKFGMAVTGEVAPARVMTNRGLEAGQELILTKPLGVGVVTTAIKAGRATPEQERRAVESMVRLNADAARIAVDAGVTGCTDVTGFGLLGHLGRMAIESRVRVEVDFSSLPFLDGAIELAVDGMIAGGTRRNLDWGRAHLDAGGHDELDQLLLADAQTSGGLVFGVDPRDAGAVLDALARSGHTAARIGIAAPLAEDAAHLLLR